MKSEKGILYVLMASSAVIVLVTVLTLFSGKESGKGKTSAKPSMTVIPTRTVSEKNPAVFAMVCSVDSGEGKLSLRRLDEKEELLLTYETAADIRDKYGSLTYAASLKYGDIVQVEYTRGNELIALKKSAEHWELRGIEDFMISDTMISVNGVNYRITERTVFYCEGEEISPGEVKSIDRINLCGLESEIFSVCVTRGHGSVRLVNSEAYQGAKVTVGGEVYTLTGEPSYLVPEGECRVTVVGEKDAAQVDLTIARNEQKVIDLYEYGGKPTEYSTVRFHISPFSAVLTIDGEAVDYYEQDLTLAYGEHKITVSLGGYRSYQGLLSLAKAYQSFRIDLIENTQTVTETGKEDGTEAAAGREDGAGDIGDTGETDSSEDPGGQTGNTDDAAGQNPGTETERAVYWISDALVETMGFACDKANDTRITGPAGAEVKIEGISIGTAPVRFGKLLGTYTITIVKDGVATEHVVTVSDDGVSVSFEFED